MRNLVPFLTGPALVAAAAAASAEPARLSEGELGQVAAGQGLEFSLSTLQATSSTTSNANDADTATSVFESSVAAEQSLAGQSSNSVNALGMLGSADVSAAGNANAALTGSIGNTVP